MGIEDSKKKVRKVVRVLHKIEPTFISLVDHGANQTPFKVLKTVVKGDFTMSETVKIKQLIFSKDKFDADSVNEYLDGFGVKKASLEETDETYVFDNYEVPEDMEVCKEDIIPDVIEGIQVKTVELRKKESTEDTKKQDDSSVDVSESKNAKKYDMYDAEYSDGKSLAEVMVDGFDGLPIGMYEITRAAMVAIRNSILDGEISNITKIASDFGKAITIAVESFSSITDEEVTKLESLQVHFATTEKKDYVISGKDVPAAKEVAEIPEVPEVTEPEVTKDAEVTPDEEEDTTEKSTDDPKPSTETEKPSEDSIVEKITKSQESLFSKIAENFTKKLSDLSERIDSMEGDTQQRASQEYTSESEITLADIEINKLKTEKLEQELEQVKKDDEFARKMKLDAAGVVNF